jgi:NADP-dependent 3-hydroxy acid dehydrogenase YdfG
MESSSDSTRMALITGASSGIGEATARALCKEGYRVVLVARSVEKLRHLAHSLGARAVVEPCDAGCGESVLAMSERVRAEFGTPDVIINSAGAGDWKRIEETTPDEAVDMMKAPYFAAFNITHAFMRGMLQRDRGVIIHVGSPVSLFTWPSCTGYAAARWALRGLHEALCDDLYDTRVRSCHVVFGKVASRYFVHNPLAEKRMPSIVKAFRTLTPDECAEIIVRLVRRPRRQVIHPWMLRPVSWSYKLFPWPTRFLLRRTGAKRK